MSALFFGSLFCHKSSILTRSYKDVMNMKSVLLKIIIACLLFAGWQSEALSEQQIIFNSPPNGYALGTPPDELSSSTDEAFLSASQSAAPSSEPPVLPGVRSSVVDFYNSVYLPTFSVPIDWTGDPGSCDAGSTSQAYIDASFDLINYYRAMVELPPVVNDVSKNAASQEAALMMSVNNALSHNPSQNWTCYSANGANAAGSSNIALGAAGPRAIALYINDPGGGNTAVGHRRWILHPPRSSFGIGSVGGSTRAANALWVFAGTTSRPATDIVAWPSRGFVPYQVVYPRWSFSLNTEPRADYSSATVSMMEGGVPVNLVIVSDDRTGYGDNTLIWTPSGLNFSAGQADRVFDIEISNVGNAGQEVYTYQVTVIDPAMVVVEADLFSDSFE
jgi:uncharacterized protein YkwD